ncbi:MAG TPA: NUDIX hydrolase [Rhabdochlamydiaceae bacterium]|nr:NUDIX hydrolase [Rhabdochlamydiaceae bacterium]
MGNNSERQSKQETSGLINSEWIHKGRIISLRMDTFKLEDGSSIKREIVVHPGAVVMIPVAPDGDLFLVKQWRRAAQKILIELPAGTLEENESPEACAHRELQEEIGYKAKNLISFGKFFSAPGFCNELLHLYLATDLIESSLKGEDTDEIDILKISMEKALSMIDNLEIWDAKTIAGILKYHRWLQR